MGANSLSAVIETVRHTQLTTLLPSYITKDREELIAINLAPFPPATHGRNHAKKRRLPSSQRTAFYRISP
jgi:hypothetical protein